MILHIVSPSPYSSDALQRCLNVATAQDAVLLIEDAALALGNPARFLGDGIPVSRWFVLAPDLAARGIPMPANTQATPIDYDGFVTLTTQFHKTVSWF